MLDRYGPALLRTLRRRAARLGLTDEAADVYQSSVVTLLETAHRVEFGGERGVERWWYRIAAHELLRRTEKRARGHAGLDRDPSAPASGGMAHEELEAVRRSIWSLSARHREVLVLRALHRYPWSLIAQVTGRASEGAVRRAYSRALATLRRTEIS